MECLCCYSCCVIIYFFFFKQNTAYEMRISDWSSDVCSSDLYWSWLRIVVRSSAPFSPEAPVKGCTMNCALPVGVFQTLCEAPTVRRKPPFLRTRLLKSRKSGKTASMASRIDRKSVVKGKRVSVRVDFGGRRIIKKKQKTQ